MSTFDFQSLATPPASDSDSGSQAGAPDWEVARRMVVFNLWAIGEWAHSEADVARVFGHALAKVADSAERDRRIKTYRTQINREDVRVVMHVLAMKALASRGREAGVFTVNGLAKALDRPRWRSMRNSLTNWILPMLQSAGYVDGFYPSNEWSPESYEIQITDRGLEAMGRYLQRLHGRLTTDD